MHVLTEIGEVGITWEGRTYRLRPSFASMAQIGTPAEIVEAFVLLNGAPAATGKPWVDAARAKRWRRDQFRMALTVLYACAAPDDDLGPLIGGVSERMGYQPGRLPLDAIVALARSLLRHGVTGDVPDDAPKQGKGEYSSTFKARDYVASAMAHLGASEAEAWAMTMTSFIAAMTAKYPPTDAKGRPMTQSAPMTQQRADEAMAWLERVNAARRSKK